MIDLQSSNDDRGKRLDQFLHERLPEYSRARLQQWIDAGRVRVYGASQKRCYALRGSERISVEPGELPPLRARAEDLPREVLFPDDDHIANNNPARLCASV